MNYHVARVRSFLQFYWNYAALGIAPHRGRFYLITCLDILSALGRAALIAVLALFVGLMESSGSITIPYLDLSLSNDLGSVVAVCVLLFAVQLFSAWAAYFSSVESRGIARAFFKTITVKVVNSYATRLRRYGDKNSFQRVTVHRHIMLGARQSSIALESVIRLIRPILYAVVATLMLYYLDPKLTLLLMPISILVAPLAYRVSAVILADAKSFYNEQAQAMGAKVNEYLTELESATYAENKLVPFDPLMESTAEFKSFLDGYDRMVLANERMNFAVSSFNAAVIASAFLIFGYHATIGGRSWSTAIAYVAAIIFLATSAQTIFSYLATLSRFYPQLRGLAAFIENADPSQSDLSTKPATQADSFNLSSSVRINANVDALTVRRGEPVLLLFSDLIHRATFGSIVAPLVRNADTGADFLYSSNFVSNRDRQPLGVLSNRLLSYCEASVDRERLLAHFDSLNLAPAIDQLRDGIDTDMNLACWADCKNDFKSAVRLLPLFDSTRDVVIIDSKLFGGFNRQQRDRIFSLLESKFVIVVGDAILPWMRAAMSTAILSYNDEICCFVDFDTAQLALDELGDSFTRNNANDNSTTDPDEDALISL